jgi:hypothetical protein
VTGIRNPQLQGQLIDLAKLPLDPAGADFKPLKVLFIGDFLRGQKIPDLSVVMDYLEAIQNYSRHELVCVNSREGIGDPCPDFSRFDAVLIHYTTYLTIPSFFPKPYAKAFRRFGGLKVVILQDEYRWGDATSRQLERFGVHMILSSLTTANLPLAYRAPGLASIDKCSALPGYIPERMLGVSVPPIEERPLHVTYRGREKEYWLGALSQEKGEIARRFAPLAAASGLACDISTDEGRRLQGGDWIALLCAGRATLGVEGGASIFDFDGEAERRTRQYLALHPSASYEEVLREVLAPFEGNVMHRTLTPRCLEAICLKTALILYPGEYRGILQPHRHYIPLERDFSNIEEVIRKVKDGAFLQDLVDRAYEEIAASPDHRFTTFVKRLDFLMHRKWAALQTQAKPGLMHRLFGRAA